MEFLSDFGFFARLSRTESLRGQEKEIQFAFQICVERLCFFMRPLREAASGSTREGTR